MNDIEAYASKIVNISNELNKLLQDVPDNSLAKNYLEKIQIQFQSSIKKIVDDVFIDHLEIQILHLQDERSKLMAKGIKTEEDRSKLMKLNEQMTYIYNDKMFRAKNKV